MPVLLTMFKLYKCNFSSRLLATCHWLTPVRSVTSVYIVHQSVIRFSEHYPSVPLCHCLVAWVTRLAPFDTPLGLPICEILDTPLIQITGRKQQHHKPSLFVPYTTPDGGLYLSPLHFRTHTHHPTLHRFKPKLTPTHPHFTPSTSLTNPLHAPQTHPPTLHPVHLIH